MGNNKKKSEQLGMAHGTAAGRLRKMVLWKYVTEAAANYCFQCGDIIDSIDELSIEHKEPWLDSDDPVGLYFDLNNIAFSHLTCNIKEANQRRIGEIRSPTPDHGTYQRYRSKSFRCRCGECTRANTEYSRAWDKKTGRTGHN